MKPVPKRVAALAIAALAAGTVAACGSSGGNNSGNNTSAGTPTRGGTLRFVSSGDFDHVDTVSAYYIPSFQLQLAWTRQLVSYYPSNTFTRATTIAADVATEVPSQANGGISADGLTYTFHIRPGVMWDSSPARQVTSQDFLREFKAMCNTIAPVGNNLYYAPVIAGMNDYCNAETSFFAKIKSPTAAQIAGFQNSHQISGITTPSSSEIQFKLTQRANDFLNILAMPFASARPIEYDSYIPDSTQFRAHTLSDGPYRISTYVPGKKIVLTRNPVWKQSTDSLRHDYVNSIEVTEGVASPETAQAEVQANSADMVWDLPVPTAQIPALQSSHNPGLHIQTNTGSSNPFLVMNEQSATDNHALSKVLVRQAIEYAINKVALAKIYGGTGLNPILNGAIAPGNIGYSNYNYYPTLNNEGNPAKCKSMLAQAGYPNGLTLRDAYRNAGNHPAVFQSVQADLAKCGIKTIGVPEQQGPYYAFLNNCLNSAKPGQWDISEPGWVPDWLGNNGRANVVPLFQSDCTANTSNQGDIHDPTVDGLIKQALTASTPAAAVPFWTKAGQQVMKDAGIVPFMSQDVVLFTGKRVHGLVYSPIAEQFNPTWIWLSPTSP